MRSNFSRTWSPERGLLLLAIVCAVIPMLISTSGVHRTIRAAIEAPRATAVPGDDRGVHLTSADPPGSNREALTVETCNPSAVHSDGTKSSLEERYASAIQRFYSELDRASTCRFDRGGFLSYQVGDEWPGRLSENSISAVRPAGGDMYKLVVFDRAISPDLYRLQEEVSRLGEALSAQPGVEEHTEVDNS